ncbi:MAG: hypothetical protein ACREOR_09910, partial [Candidatus Binatia bacterium]
MVIRYASAVLTLAGLLALVSGLLFGTANALNLVSAQMLLGLLSVGAISDHSSAWAVTGNLRLPSEPTPGERKAPMASAGADVRRTTCYR